MQPDRFRRAEEIFHGVVDLPAAERGPYLDAVCGADAELRAEALSLVESYDAASQACGAGREASAVAVERIGPYRVERELGAGGMGTVYLASRADRQYEKHVAIKLVRAGAGGEALIRRFFTERQILAGMEHPNIARLLDGGLTESGRPYLVMDYVDGVRLDRYCDQHRLSIRTRLELFRKVCAAVDYAHRHLVIHRDLKPSNILVTADGEPKLLDFGVAKALDPSGAADPTITAGLFLTPLYASPELLRGQATSVASDVYSLGVILYELLCGFRPYHAPTLNPVEYINAVVTRDPDRPSAAGGRGDVSDRQEAATPGQAAELRGETPERLRKLLRGDLDLIVLKAIARDVQERYGSVEHLSEDLRRHLEGQPVQAMRGSRTYRARKFIGRHKLGVASAALAAVSLAAGAAGTVWQAHVARTERANAESRFDDAHKLATYLLFDLFTSVQKLPGSTPVQANMAARALEYFDRLGAAKSADPTLQVELAEGYNRLGDVLGNPFDQNLGQTPKALESYRKALALAGPLAAREKGDYRARLAAAKARQGIGGILVFGGKAEEGLGDVQKSAEELDRLAAEHPGDASLRLTTGNAYHFLGRNLSQRGGFIAAQDGGRAMASLEKATGHIQAGLAIEPQNPRGLRLLALAYQTTGILVSPRDPKRALDLMARALATLDRLPPDEKESLDSRRLRASVLLNRGWDLGQSREYGEAIATLEEGRAILESLAAADPKNTAALYHCAIAYRNLGIVNGYAGRDAQTLAQYAKAIRVYDDLTQRDPANANYPLYRAELQARSGSLLAKRGRMDEARAVAGAGIAYLAQLAERPNAPAAQLQDAARYLMTTEVVALRDYPRALRFALRANEVSKGEDVGALEYLAEAYWLNGDAARAVETISQALAHLPPTAPGEKPSRARLGYEEELARYRRGRK
jgi:serine/threonine protein kinase